METPFTWALIGPGRIARRFAEAVGRLPHARLGAIGGRDLARAQAFADEWAPGEPGLQVSADLVGILANPAIDAVYIATPHAFHGEAIRACIEAGKPVLCEKPLVPSRAMAVPLIDLARERRVFLMEAVWTRFLPAYRIVRAWLEQGAIGPVRAIQSTFCFAAPYEPHSRLFDPALAGGALLDIGIYNLTMTRWVLQAVGRDPTPLEIQAQGSLAPTGVDRQVAATLAFADGLTSQFTCSFDVMADNSLRILGERGVIALPQTFWESTEAVLHIGGSPPQAVPAPFAINGFEYEIEEAMRCIRAGEIESPAITHDDTLATLGWMDEIRRQVGVRYPFE